MKYSTWERLQAGAVWLAFYSFKNHSSWFLKSSQLQKSDETIGNILLSFAINLYAIAQNQFLGIVENMFHNSLKLKKIQL